LIRTLRPIFTSGLRAGLRERSRALALRKYLIDICCEYEVLKKAYDAGGEKEIAKIVGTTNASKKKNKVNNINCN